MAVFSQDHGDNAVSLYLAIAVLQAASATFTPAFQALIPKVLPGERDYTAALSLSRLAYDLEAIASPILAAGALFVVSYHGLFMGTAGGFFGSLLLVVAAARSLPARRDTGRQEPFRKRTLLGVRLMVRVPELRGVLWLNLAVAAPMAMVLVNTVVIVRTTFQWDDAVLAWLFAAFGAGSMLIALVVPRLRERFGDYSLMLAGGGASIGGMALLYLTLVGEAAWALWALWPVLGAALALMQTPMSQVLRLHIAEKDLDAVFAAQFSLSHACYLVAYPLAGWAGSEVGPAWATLVLMLIGLCGVLLSAYTSLSARQFEQTLAVPTHY